MTTAHRDPILNLLCDSIGCQIKLPLNATIVRPNLQLFDENTIVEFVVRFFALNVVAIIYLDDILMSTGQSEYVMLVIKELKRIHHSFWQVSLRFDKSLSKMF